MKHTYRELKTDSELLTAAMFGMLVYVVDAYDPEEMHELGGVIDAYTLRRVRIDGEWYARGDFSFRVDR